LLGPAVAALSAEQPAEVFSGSAGLADELVDPMARKLRPPRLEIKSGLNGVLGCSHASEATPACA